MLPDGATRWISSQGRVEFDATGQPVLIRGAARDVTARKQAEQETLLLRQEIAHAGRVSMMGQLASALAHEINQPLGAILRNAEAAELFLQHPSPDLDEIRAILADIRSDDERAGTVIDRMRGLLKRQTLDTRTARRRRAGRRSGGAGAGRCRDAAGEARCRYAGRSAAGSGRPRADSAGTAQPDSQRHGRAPRDEAGRSARPVTARRRGRADRRDRRQRRRARHSCRHAGADLRPVLHDQAERHGHGPGDLAHHRRGARRTTVGGEPDRRRRGISFHAADCGGGRRAHELDRTHRPHRRRRRAVSRGDLAAAAGQRVCRQDLRVSK